MPANKGNTVQEQTARIPPETDATPYARKRFALLPRYFRTVSCFTNTLIAPEIKKKQGLDTTKHVRVHTTSLTQVIQILHCRIFAFLLVENKRQGILLQKAKTF
jgi:hypothetical protein